jgi:hypothetical protein
MPIRETIDYSAERSWFAAGDHPLEVRERDRLARALQPGETWTHFVRGRVDGKDAVWVLTEGRVVSAALGFLGRSQAVAVRDVRAFEVEEGAHGWTIRLDHADGRLALVAAPPSLGRGFVAELEGRTGKTVGFVASRRQGNSRFFVSRAAGAAPMPAASGPPAAALSSAPADHTAVALTAALREAADLHQRGVLSDDEFAALKRKLLGG